MQHKARLMLVALLAVMTVGCASNNVKQAADDFADGTISNAAHRQQKKQNQSVYDDNKLKKEDSAAGILNIGLQGFLRLFKSAEPE
ncbi:hypothetical protein [Arsukibacterium sp.]|uniref:hypothetical protein n=1 Tax=Arsukibacterium sp. TaxID=1977258 RepID=UPI003567B69B